ncbi:MAG: hypothetical protein Q8S42_19685 [Archangium sp.]|nr:hypothetical protein [Archangium sp.]
MQNLFYLNNGHGSQGEDSFGAGQPEHRGGHHHRGQRDGSQALGVSIAAHEFQSNANWLPARPSWASRLNR